MKTLRNKIELPYGKTNFQANVLYRILGWQIYAFEAQKNALARPVLEAVTSYV